MPAMRYESHDLYLIYSMVRPGAVRLHKAAGLEEEAPYNEADDIVFFKEPEQGGAVLEGRGLRGRFPRTPTSPAYCRYPARCVRL